MQYATLVLFLSVSVNQMVLYNAPLSVPYDKIMNTSGQPIGKCLFESNIKPSLHHPQKIQTNKIYIFVNVVGCTSQSKQTKNDLLCIFNRLYGRWNPQGHRNIMFWVNKLSTSKNISEVLSQVVIFNTMKRCLCAFSKEISLIVLKNHVLNSIPSRLYSY